MISRSKHPGHSGVHPQVLFVLLLTCRLSLEPSLTAQIFSEAISSITRDIVGMAENRSQCHIICVAGPFWACVVTGTHEAGLLWACVVTGALEAGLLWAYVW